MKKHIVTTLMVLMSLTSIHAQNLIDGVCGEDVKWSFDGNTLTIYMTKEDLLKPMNDYGMKNNISPWRKKKLDIKSVRIGKGVTSIGSCAFAGCDNLAEIIFEGTNVKTIGWGAFYNCTRLHSISLPVKLTQIGAVAFANCRSLNRIQIPAQCRVEDRAFASCDNLQSIECAPTAVLGQLVFVKEETDGKKLRHSFYSGNILRLPPYVNVNNCHVYGLAKEAVEKVMDEEENNSYDEPTCLLDENIPVSLDTRNDTYVLIIGNQKYRFASDVTYAIHDARVFREYCERTLGIPALNIHVAENATKQMILEEEMEDWLGTIQDREKKRLIIYYAGHGVPDTRNQNKSYLLPTDVRGENPKRGIALDDFYAKVGDLDFKRATILMDACFSGVNRSNDGVTEGMRGVEIEVDETPLSEGRVVVFSAAQGNETAQGYPEQGHGLFTYYLLDEIRESRGDVSLGTLSDHIIKGVSRTAPNLKMRKKQTPSTCASKDLEDIWKSLSF